MQLRNVQATNENEKKKLEEKFKELQESSEKEIKNQLDLRSKERNKSEDELKRKQLELKIIIQEHNQTKEKLKLKNEVIEDLEECLTKKQQECDENLKDKEIINQFRNLLQERERN